MEEAFGKVYAPRDVEREEVKGRGGLEEVLRSTLGEDRARRVILEISRVFGRPSEGMVIARYGTGFAVADRVKRMLYVAREADDGWSSGRYRVEQHDGITLLKPERTVSGVFAVEVSLPEREGWVRIALTPGNWLVLFGWVRDFNLLTTDDKVLFRGRAPYDEVQYDLGDVSIVFWYCGCALDLKGHPWYEEIFRSMIIWDAAGRLKDRCSDYDSPRGQYEHGFFLGQGIIIRVSTRKPVVLEFRTLKYALKYGDFMRYFGYRGFYTFTYWVRHSPHGLLKYVCLAVLPTMVLFGMVTYKLAAQFIPPPLPIRGRRSRRRGAA